MNGPSMPIWIGFEHDAVAAADACVRRRARRGGGDEREADANGDAVRSVQPSLTSTSLLGMCRRLRRSVDGLMVLEQCRRPTRWRRCTQRLALFRRIRLRRVRTRCSTGWTAPRARPRRPRTTAPRRRSRSSSMTPRLRRSLRSACSVPRAARRAARGRDDEVLYVLDGHGAARDRRRAPRPRRRHGRLRRPRHGLARRRRGRARAPLGARPRSRAGAGATHALVDLEAESAASATAARQFLSASRPRRAARR